MKQRQLWLWALVAVAIGLLAGSWLGDRATEGSAAPETTPPAPRLPRDNPRPPLKLGNRPEPKTARDQDAHERGALPGQRSIRFGSADALAAFLRSIEGSGIAVLGRIDGLNTLRVGFLDPAELDDLLGDGAESDFIYPAFIPGEGGIQPGAVSFGDRFLEWLGVPGDRTGVGESLRIAVLDTGIGDNRQFSNRVKSTNLVDLPENSEDLNGHGTAVASLIASQLGLVPDADLFSYRIADDFGVSDTFLIAEAIMMAAEQGVDLINISLGSSGRSATLEDAVNFASEKGSIIVASGGNDGFERVAFPAAFDRAIGVGSVDARGELLDFSNRGDISLVAPGLGVTSAWTGDQFVSFTGTSASAPLATGAIAYVMSAENVSARKAVELITAHANEAGAPGADAGYGAGMIDLGRIRRRNQEGFTDLAVASNHFATDDRGRTVVQVTVENRGTTQTINSPVEVTTPGGTQQLNVVGLAPGDIRTFDIPVPSDRGEVRVHSRVDVGEGSSDFQPGNNSRTDVFVPDEPR